MVAYYTSLQLAIAEVKYTVEKISKRQDGQDKNVELVFKYIDRLQEKLETPTRNERKRIGYEVGGKVREENSQKNDLVYYGGSLSTELQKSEFMKYWPHPTK